MSSTNFPSKTAQEVVEQYAKLNPALRGNLTDFYNRFLGLKLIADGEDWQREIAMDGIQERIADSRDPFPLFAERMNFAQRILKSIEAEDGEFSEIDSTHLRELDQLIGFANAHAAAETLNSETASRIYNLLIPYLYGRER